MAIRPEINERPTEKDIKNFNKDLKIRIFEFLLKQIKKICF